MGIEEVKNYVIEKSKELFFLLDNLSGQFLGWFDKVLPPETRNDKINHWFHVALPFLIAALVFSLISYCCYCCCCRGRGRGRGRGHMMKAPGRNCRMERSTFESDPRAYFRNLRSYPGDQLKRPRGRGRGHMMKAPGRNCRMERSTFESDPRAYFRNLRSYPGDQLV